VASEARHHPCCKGFSITPKDITIAAMYTRTIFASPSCSCPRARVSTRRPMGGTGDGTDAASTRIGYAVIEVSNEQPACQWVP